MSRTSQFTSKKNPAALSIEWAGAGDKGHFKAYDKETKTKVEINKLSFIVLDQRACVNGYYAKENTGAWSNEVKNLSQEPLRVRFKDGEIASGLYSEIGDEMKNLGIKYHKVIYALIAESDQVESGTVAKIMLKGAASFEWSNFCKNGDPTQCIEFGGFIDKQNGAIKFRVPEFKTVEIPEGLVPESEFAYEEVKAYFDNLSHSVEEVAVDDSDDDLPFD